MQKYLKIEVFQRLGENGYSIFVSDHKPIDSGEFME